MIWARFRMQNLLQGLKGKKNKHLNAEITCSQENWFQGIILMFNYLLFKLCCSLGDYVSPKFHQAEQANKEKSDAISIAADQIDKQI